MMRVRHNFNPQIWSGKSKLAMGSGGSPPSPPTNPATTALLAQMAVQPTAPPETLINDFFNSLDTASIGIASFDGLWFHNLQTQQQSNLNWAAPAALAALPVSSPTWTTKLGYHGNGTSSYVDYRVTVDGSGTNYHINDGSFGCWDSENNSPNTYHIGILASSNLRLLTRSAVNAFSCNINSATAGPQQASANAEGFYSVNRSASNAAQCYKDGLNGPANSSAANSTGISGNLLGLRSVNTFANRQILMAYIGRTMNQTEITALTNAVTTFKLGVDAL